MVGEKHRAGKIGRIRGHTAGKGAKPKTDSGAFVLDPHTLATLTLTSWRERGEGGLEGGGVSLGPWERDSLPPPFGGLGDDGHPGRSRELRGKSKALDKRLRAPSIRAEAKPQH